MNHRITRRDPFAAWTPTSTGILVPPGKRFDRPIAVDLFCGAGGMGLGFVNAGFHVVAAADYDPHAMLTYMINHGTYPCKIHYIDPEDEDRADRAARSLYSGMLNKDGTIKAGPGLVSMGAVSGSARLPDHPGCEHFWLGDIRNLSGADILDALNLRPGDVDVVCGGPPCQGFSSAGKQNVMDPRNSLVFEFARLILEIRPKAFVFENVPGIINMLTPEGVPVLDAICRVLEDGNFGTFDALKRSMLTSSGSGAALRGSKGNIPVQRPSRRAEKTESENENAQLSFLEVV